MNDMNIDHRNPYPMDTLEKRDQVLEQLWREFEDVPMDPETECMEDWFLGFEPGTSRWDILHWFDDRHSRGIGYLMYMDGIDRTRDLSCLLYRRELCPDCDSETCAYNPAGFCLLPMATGKAPGLNDYGCTDWLYKGERT